MNRKLHLTFSLFALAIGTLATMAATAVRPTTRHPADQVSAPTFNKDVAPIIFNNCAVCHHSGGSAPFSLTSYLDVKRHARQIVAVTSKRVMPPWLPEPGYGTFVGARRLSSQQIHTLAQWAAAGAKEGVASDIPLAPRFSDGWQLGKPDLIVRVAQPYILLPGGNTESWPGFILPIHISETRYIKGIEIRPGNPRVVHHCYIVTDRTGISHIANGEAYQLGSTGMENRIAASGSELDSRFLTWRPGTPPYFEPEGATWRLDKDTDLTLYLHLLTSGKAEAVQPTVGFYFSDRPPDQFPTILRLDQDDAIDIPPGAKDYIVSDHLELPVGVRVLAILPHGHYLCRQMEAFATLPDGSRRWLIWIKRWNFDWQGVFRYVEPVSLPKGTVISMRYSYDNSADNPLNPNTPPRRVRGGPKSTDEMADLWLEVLPAHREDLFALQVAQMERRLAKYPNDLERAADLGAALRSMAAALQDMGKNEEALAPLRQATRLEPDDAQLQNNLAAALGSLRHYDEAIFHFREALRLRPDYFLACMNLASVLTLRGDLEEARAYFGQAVQMNPGSSEAHDKLGIVYAQLGNLIEAMAQFQDALRIDPNDSFARESLRRAQETLRNIR